VNELVIKGKKYISSKRASELTGYAKDYVGQLVRMGKLTAERVGRAWYVEEEALLAHSGSTERNEAEKREFRKRSLALFQGQEYNLSQTWGEVSYIPDTGDLFPSLKSLKAREHEEPLAESEIIHIPTRIIRSHDLNITHILSNTNNTDFNKEEKSRLPEKHTNKGTLRGRRNGNILQSVMASGVVFLSFGVFSLAVFGVFFPLEIKTGSRETASVFLASHYAEELSQASFSAIFDVFSDALSSTNQLFQESFFQSR